MDVLGKIIQSLNKEEVRFFKLYTKRTETDGDRKDIVLFDFIRKQGIDYDENKIFKKLYGSNSKNPYYRLKNRLAQDLNKCLTIQHYFESEELQVYNILTLVKIYYDKSEFEIAYYYLKKAEKEALKIENFELLDTIYSEYIKLSQESLKINPKEYIDKRKSNLSILSKLREIDDLLATVIYQTKTTLNFSKKNTGVLEELEAAVTKLSQDQSINIGNKMRIKIYRSLSQIFLRREQYKILEEYLLNTFSQFEELNLFTKSTHDTKLQMLTFLVNCFYINSKTEQSVKYLEILAQGLDEYDGILKSKYQFFYHNALVNHYASHDKEKAIDVLEGLQKGDFLRKRPYYEIFVYGSLANLHFDLGNFKTAAKTIHKLYLLDSYKNADSYYKLRTSVAELIMRYEIKDFDFLDYRLKQVEKEFAKELEEPGTIREQDLLAIITDLIDTPILRENKDLINRIKEFLDRDEISYSTDMISYNTWLSQKVK